MNAWFAALAREAIPDFSWGKRVNFRQEVIAGLAGALLVIPQAIKFAYLAGVQPVYGLYCAVFVGFLSSLFGNSPLVGGPNTAVSIMLGLAAIRFAGSGSPLYVEFVFALSFLVGLIQLVIWLLRGAVLFRYFSPAAISGIKAGIGVLLITSALEGALGIEPLSTQFFYEKFYLATVSWMQVVNPYAVAISTVTIGLGLLLKRRWPRTYIIAATVAGSLLGLAIYAFVGPLQSGVELLGRVPFQAMPFTIPHLTPQHWLFLEQSVANAVAIAVLGLAQSLVIARDLKARVSSDLDLHKEVFAQGISNLVSPLFSSFAGSGSFNRTCVAVEMGARSPLSGMVAAVAVVLVAYVLGPSLSVLPMPAIAGVLALVGIGMVQGERKSFAYKVEGAVFGAALLSVLFLGLEAGICVAIAASIALFVARASRVDLAITREGHKERIVVVGNLYHASLDGLATHLRNNPGADTILDLRRVLYCDSAAQEMIQRIQGERPKQGGQLEIAVTP